MKRHYAFALLAALAATASSALAVPESDFGKVKELMENRDGFFSTGTFIGAEMAKIAYTKFGSESGEKGCLVVSPGQGEASMKYLEVAYDLSQKGFSPIYVIDHRGQGASDRLLPSDPQKNSVRKFDHYVADLETLVDTIVLKDAACRGHKTSLLAHSMGGAIAAAYLEKVGASSPFKRVAMSAPMMKIAFPQGKTENGVLFETWAACTFPVVKGMRCDDYAPGKGPYDASAPFSGNLYTHSEPRFGFKKDLYAKWPNLISGGPTIRWVRQSTLADVALRKPQNTARIDAKILLLQAEKDQIVDNSGENEFCANTRGCKLVRVSGSNHEILMESDSIRDPALGMIADFLGN